MSRFFAFGCSFTKSHTPTWADILAANFTHYQNWGKPGAGNSFIFYSLIECIKRNNITKDDIVIVIVPPDTRWYDENETKGFYTLMNWQREDYFKFLNNKTLEWFKYHHLLFIYSIQKILNDIGCYYIMAHNFGQISETQKYKLHIDYTKFLSKVDLSNLLSEVPQTWLSYPDSLPAEHRFDQDGPPQNLFTGKYFLGCKFHPNELGHKRIAELILKKYYNDQK